MKFSKSPIYSKGNLLNASKLGQSLDLSHNTIKRYIDILEQTFMVRVLRPLETNLKKRLVKSPKVYLRDTGILHVLLEIESRNDLFGNPVFGASWEGWCIEQIICSLPGWRPYFYRTSSGEEMDLILERGTKRLVFECKASAAPRLSKGFMRTKEALAPDAVWAVCPIDQPSYPIHEGVRVIGPDELLNDLGRYRTRS